MSKKFALLEPDGRIAQVVEEPFDVAPTLRWVEVDDTVTTEHRVVQGRVQAPPEPAAVALPTYGELVARVEALEAALEALGKG